MKKKNTKYAKKSNLDQFYTSIKIAKECYDKVIDLYGANQFSMFLEPAAGTGSFFNIFPNDKRVGIDLEPKCDEVKKFDFLQFSMPNDIKIATISNPPFGKCASLAIKFFNKAAEFSEVIAFIVPKTFRKASVQKKLHRNFHLKLDVDIEKDAFILNGLPYNVPCCFQIWERGISKRKIVKVKLENKFFSFVKKEGAPDLAVRRVGGRAGKATTEIETSAAVSHYFLKMKDKNSPEWLMEKINNIDFSKTVNSTAGVRSLSKPEFVSALMKVM